LVWSGDAGTTEASGRTRRIGADFEVRTRITDWLWADADLNLARGRLVDEPEGADRIPLAPTLTGTAGFTLRDLGPLNAGLRVRAVGNRPADQSSRVRALGYAVTEIVARYRIRAVEVTMAVDNLFDVHWNEAQFATTSRLAGESEPVTELHFTPGARRGVQVGARYRW
jgi:outer membrane receptor for ferric coprogen and ferric-rhodotorulic acid